MRQDDDQALAVTLALLLLIGAVLIAREVLGLWLAFGLPAAAVVAAYWCPTLVWRLAVRRLVRQVRRYGR
ncbi:hypothetical protein [Streptomyces niveus]|uniref:hypothetical protein n=1 Tax=Streptomyces niveus TaxID=193462 RepID=UPI0003C5D08C|nr:hypothetical protein [Streptomyces niveus]EST17868.1 hypothetical protein M877_40125 [Streptomyces niveus NCIMB 11891]